MPHDCNGVEIQEGDEVIVRFKVKGVFQMDTACNCNLEPIDVADCRDYFPTLIACNSRFTEVLPRLADYADYTFTTDTTHEELANV